MGGKVGDENCIPLCPRCHVTIHNNRRDSFANPAQAVQMMQAAWERKHGTRPWEDK
jgi:predicted HNH restriction endonuclease